MTLSGYGGFGVFVKTVGSPAAMSKTLESSILSTDKNIVPQQSGTMTELLDQFLFSPTRFGVQLFSVFASIGFVLVCVGVYSVISYTVSQQQKEIGIRMALGASAGNVRGLVIRAGMRFVIVGILIGALLSFLLLRVMQNQIAGIKTYDPVTLISVVAILLLAGFGASYVPSRRATLVDPLISLRYE